MEKPVPFSCTRTYIHGSKVENGVTAAMVLLLGQSML